MSHFRGAHELVIFIVRTVTGPNLRAWFDILQSNKNKIRMLAELLDGCILEVRFYSVDLGGRRIDGGHMGAVILAIEVFIRVRLFPGALRYGGNIVIASGGVVIRNESAAQLADHFPFFDSHGGKQAVAGVGNRRFSYHRPLIIFYVYLEYRRILG